MLADGGGDQPPPPHVWQGCLITGILQEAWLEDCITKAMVLSPGEAILFFGWHLKDEGLPYHRARDVEFCLGGLFNWAWRSVQIEALRKTMQEGHHAILKAVVEKKMTARGAGQPLGKTRHPKFPAVAYDVEEWMQGLAGDTDGDLKWNDNMNHRADWQSNSSQWRSPGQGRQRWLRAPWFLREPLGGSLSLRGNSLDGQSEWSSWHSN